LVSDDDKWVTEKMDNCMTSDQAIKVNTSWYQQLLFVLRVLPRIDGFFSQSDLSK
jgi:hypothetical protein